MKNVIIGIAELSIVKIPDKVTTLGLGSCVGVVLYDRRLRMAGMVHILLPQSDPSSAREMTNKAKFADTAVPELFNQMLRNGARREALVAKMAGGAHMFGNINTASDLLKVGQRNVKQCREMLRKINVPLIAEDVEGTYGRTITFDTLTGLLHIRTVGYGEKDI